MGSIADKLSKLMETKSAIKSAITTKGVTVSDSDPFSSYAGKIAQIEGGGGGEAISALIEGTITDYSGNETSIRERCFYGCNNLVSANFPNAKSIGSYSFSYCDSLGSLSLPLVTIIPDYGIYGCKVLTTVNLYSVEKIESRGLGNCYDLTLINLPALSEIDTYAFSHCSSLTSIIILNNNICKLNGKNAFNGTPIESGTGYIYVPKTLVDTYKSATNWTTYADQIRAIEDYPDIANIVATMEDAA